MAFWCRIKQSQLKTLPNLYRRHIFHVPGPCLANQKSSIVRAWLLEKPTSSVIHRNHVEFGGSVRFFAAPARVQANQGESHTGQPRMNENITAAFVRLVTEEGHGVVSRFEALQCAKRLNLDLVEIQPNATPPVCKLMDYHAEKHKELMKQKERAKKSKTEVTLRQGDSKEVRLTVNTQQKDLQMKADMIKGLMERGHRVKCVVMGFRGEDFRGKLLQLAALIDDISVVEGSPMVEKVKQGGGGPKEKKSGSREEIRGSWEEKDAPGRKKQKYQAFFVARHIKFGLPKKGGKKASLAVEDMIQSQNTAPSPPKQSSAEIVGPAGSVTEEEDENLFEEQDKPLSHSSKISGQDLGKKSPTWSVFDAKEDFDDVFKDESMALPSSKDLQMNNFSGSDGPRPVVDSTRRLTRSEPQLTNQGKQSQSGYGIFCAPKTNDNSEQGGLAGEVNRYKKVNAFDSVRQHRQHSPRGVSSNTHGNKGNGEDSAERAQTRDTRKEFGFKPAFSIHTEYICGTQERWPKKGKSGV
ncbi:hypothetical protein NMG60_11019405 [Bertholletia excelsa]